MMASDLSPVRHDYPWSRIGWMSFAVIVLSSAFIGFVFLSRYQANSETLGVWAAICRGLGIPLVEHGKTDAPPTIAGLSLAESRRYGDTTVSFYRARDAR